MTSEYFLVEDWVQSHLNDKGYRFYGPALGPKQILKIEGKELTKIDPFSLRSYVQYFPPKKESSNQEDKAGEQIYAEHTEVLLASFIEILKPFTGNFLQDSDKVKYFIYRNKALEITANGIVEMKHDDLPGYFWSSQVIQHNFTLLPVQAAKNNAFYLLLEEFSSFSYQAMSTQKLSHLTSLIGRLVNHTPGIGEDRIFFINDSTWERHISVGDTGKSLICQAVAMITPAIFLDGESVDLIKDVSDNIAKETGLAVIESEYFNNLEALEAIRTTYPNLDICVVSRLPFEEQGANQFSLTLSYDECAKNPPPIPLNKNMLKQMGPTELNSLYNMLIYCSQYHLKHGIDESANTNAPGLKALIAETSLEFVKWVLDREDLRATEISWIQWSDDFNMASMSDQLETEQFKRWVYAFAWMRRWQIVESVNIVEETFRFE